MTTNEWYQRFDGAISLDVIKSTRADSRAGMIAVSELQELIKPRHDFDRDDPTCVKCGASMRLTEGCEWPDYREALLCSSCAITVIESISKLIESQSLAK